MIRGFYLLVLLLASAAAFPLECGWPALHKGGRFGPSTVRLAQRLLGHALDQPLPVDGNWSDATENATKAFQLQAGLPISGALDAITWPRLSASCLPLTAGANGSLVSALQESLIFNGFDANVSGFFDLQTQDKLGAFQRARGASVSSGDAVDEQTWHLLVSGCNSSAATAAYWFDAGWPQGALALEQLQCLRSTGFEFAIFECWVERGSGMFWDECVGNIARAQIAGLKVGAYMFPHRSVDATLQVQQLVGNLSAFNVSAINAQNKSVLALLPRFSFFFTGDRRTPNHDRHRKRHFADMVEFFLERKSSIRAATAWRDRGRWLRRHSASCCLTRFCCIASAATQCA